MSTNLSSEQAKQLVEKYDAAVDEYRKAQDAFNLFDPTVDGPTWPFEVAELRVNAAERQLNAAYGNLVRALVGKR